MNIAVTSTLSSLDAPVGTKLRHSKYVLIVDTNTMDYKVMINPVVVVSNSAMWKLFIQELLQEDVRIILSGDRNSKLSKFMDHIGIRIIGGISGSVSSAVRQFKEMCLADTIMPIENIQE